MRAIRFHQYGGAEVLRCEDAPVPQPGPDELLLKVHAAGVNPADWQFRNGWYKDFAPRRLPFIPGWDVAGTVQAAGPLAGFAPGDPVFAMADMARDGAYAEYMVLRADAAAAAPRSIPLWQAAGVPLAALTAWSALFDHGALRAGQTVLVHGGAGGVGQFAVQLAHLAGARVLATASPANHELLRQLGADEALDYQGVALQRHAGGVDLVVDTAGGATRERSWDMLRRGGLLAGVAMPPPDAAAAQARGLRASVVAVVPNGARLRQIGALFDAGRLQVQIDSEFPLAEAAAAQVRSEGRHARGKIILRVG
ncbi:MAG TPA: NADP-dependent oxidoreductase [Nevskia sp.]|nr:NADP-dependent oxidoreductase [Nevskia sp.]